MVPLASLIRPPVRHLLSAVLLSVAVANPLEHMYDGAIVVFMCSAALGAHSALSVMIVAVRVGLTVIGVA